MTSILSNNSKPSPSHSQNDATAKLWSREALPARRSPSLFLDEPYESDFNEPHPQQQSEPIDDDNESMVSYYHDTATDEEDDSLRYQGDLGDDEMEYSHDYSDDFNVQNNYYFDSMNHVQRPPSLFESYYDADDEYNVDSTQQPPIRQISISHDCLDDDASLEYSDDESQDYTPLHSHKVTFERYEENSPQDVIHRIEVVMGHLVNYLNDLQGPVLHEYKLPEDEDESYESVNSNVFDEIVRYTSRPFKNFDNMARQRIFTSLTLVMSFIHALLLSNRTTTTREVYYVFVTHFRNQKECDSVILDVARCLGVPRRALGLSASPKGWFCGSLEITRKGTLPSGKDVSGSIDGTALSSIQGLPITREWIDRDEHGLTEDGVEIKVVSKDAKVIVVIEKEGVYNRLSEERIFDRFPCILITGKGFPDLATRALVQSLHKELDLPVVGLCDSNPFGISVLALYHCAGDRMGVDGNMKYSVPIRWIGLRPSTVSDLEDQLPKEVFQKLTDRDYKRIDALLDETHSFLNGEREEEIIVMQEVGYKVELEALYWLGPDYMGDWVVDQLKCVDDESEWERVAI